eukprot:m.208086 g.208086  ORF g.208086 m.208086 type:complete len:50 (+) comp24014_c0_seq1:2193-2342(+)
MAADCIAGPARAYHGDLGSGSHRESMAAAGRQGRQLSTQLDVKAFAVLI